MIAAPAERTIAIGRLGLDCGATLDVEQRVTLYGQPERDGSNVALVLHALTGSSRIDTWWPAMKAGGGALGAPWCVVGINALGSCYGSTGPRGEGFPRVTVRDMVRAQRRALQLLGIERIALGIGGSLGGMQALQWAVEFPQAVAHAAIVGAHDHHSALGVALNAVQREAIGLDRRRGLRLARKIAMLSYKSDDLLAHRHDRRADRHGKPMFDVEGYLERQADLLQPRMNSDAYVTLTHAMDSFDVRDAAAAQQRPKLTFVGISSDVLFRPQDVREAAKRFSQRGFDAEYLELRSTQGHDAFLADAAALSALLRPSLGTPPIALKARV